MLDAGEKPGCHRAPAADLDGLVARYGERVRAVALDVTDTAARAAVGTAAEVIERAEEERGAESGQG